MSKCVDLFIQPNKTACKCNPQQFWRIYPSRTELVDLESTCFDPYNRPKLSPSSPDICSDWGLFQRTLYKITFCYQNLIKTRYVKTQEQPADIFTKPLSSNQFRVLLGKLGVINIHSNLRGNDKNPWYHAIGSLISCN